MCGIAGVALNRRLEPEDRMKVSRMIATLRHRGPDREVVASVENMAIASARLAIVAEHHGHQPFLAFEGRIQAVYNGEIYNYRQLRQELQTQGVAFRSECDGEVLPHLYQAYGVSFVERLEGQFAIAVADGRDGSLTLVRDRMGICPLYWMARPEGVYFASEMKAFYPVGLSPQRLNPQALLQLAYFGTVCAPVTAFESVSAILPAHTLHITAYGRIANQRYWQLQFPERGHEARPSTLAATAKLYELLHSSVATHTQGDTTVATFLSGGIDSAVITALLADQQGAIHTKSFCATSPERDFDEGIEAYSTATDLGVALQSVEVTDRLIAASFEKLMYHSETPVISTEAAALFVLAQEVHQSSKVVLTGEGADEAFGGYLAFRQQRKFGYLTGSHARVLRACARPWLQKRYGTDVLVPSEHQCAGLYEHLGFFPAQAYEWEFYRRAIGPVLRAEYRNRLEKNEQWNNIGPIGATNAKTHWLNRSLDVAYHVLLPNYLLGPHGDRVVMANSVEGRYPFLARQVIEYAAALHPSYKLRNSQEKFVLRKMAQQFFPIRSSWRKKKRFAMPFGTPFLQAGAPALYSYLLNPTTLQTYGYFDHQAVAEVGRRLVALDCAGGTAPSAMQRLALGIALTVVVSTQLWHYTFVENTSIPCICSDVELGVSKVL